MKTQRITIYVLLGALPLGLFLSYLCFKFQYIKPDAFISVNISILTSFFFAFVIAIALYIRSRKNVIRLIYNASLDVYCSIKLLQRLSNHCMEQQNMNRMLLARQASPVLSSIKNVINSLDEKLKDFQENDIETFFTKSKIRSLYINSVKWNKDSIQNVTSYGLKTIVTFYEYLEVRLQTNRDIIIFENKKNEYIKSLTIFNNYVNYSENGLLFNMERIHKWLNLKNSGGFDGIQQIVGARIQAFPLEAEKDQINFFMLNQLYQKGHSLFSSGQHKQAISTFMSILSQYNQELSQAELTSIYLMLGQSYALLSDFEKSTYYLELIGGTESENIYVLEVLANNYIQLKKIPQAIKCLLHISEINPQADKLYQLARHLTNEKRYSEAINVYHDIIKIDNTYDGLYPNLIELLVIEHRLMEANELFAKYSNMYPTDFSTLFLSTLLQLSSKKEGVNVKKEIKRIKGNYKPHIYPVNWSFIQVNDLLSNSSSYYTKEQKRSLNILITKLKEWI